MILEDMIRINSRGQTILYQPCVLCGHICNTQCSECSQYVCIECELKHDVVHVLSDALRGINGASIQTSR